MYKGMRLNKIILGIAAVFFLWSIYFIKNQNRPGLSQVPSATPDIPFTTYSPPKIITTPYYVIAFLGDSMTYALGPHGGNFTEVMKSRFPKHDFIVSNYAVPATNILSIPERLNQPTKVWDVTFPPLLKWDYDVLIIESFGYNPLSQYSLDEGLQRQTEIIEQTVKQLIREKPDSLIIFLATIAPSRSHYARNVLNLSDTERQTQVNERIAYIENHIQFAQTHNIPVINVFEKSLSENGEVNLIYIDPNDYIHPSQKGVELIANEMAKFIDEQKFLPQE
jgi:lysophospholipase L1-like esterase